MIHPFIEEHNSSNLQSSSENNSTIWPLSSDSFNSFDVTENWNPTFWCTVWFVGQFFFDNFECVSDQNPFLSNIPKMTYLKILLWGLVLSKISAFKGTVMQIWKSVNIFVFIWKWYVEDIILQHLLFFEICAREIYEKFVYKHLEPIESVKN